MRSTPMNREVRTTCIGALRTGRTTDGMDEENRSAGRAAEQNVERWKVRGWEEGMNAGGWWADEVRETDDMDEQNRSAGSLSRGQENGSKNERDDRRKKWWTDETWGGGEWMNTEGWRGNRLLWHTGAAIAISLRGFVVAALCWLTAAFKELCETRDIQQTLPCLARVALTTLSQELTRIFPKHFFLRREEA